MSDLLTIKKSTCQSIADAIREKLGDSAKIRGCDLDNKIRAIPNDGVAAYQTLHGLLDGSITELTTDVDFFSSRALAYNQNLTYLDLTACISIGSNTLTGCMNLTTLVLRREESIAYASNNSFTASGLVNNGAYIYVPAALRDEYEADSVWSNFTGQFRALEDYTVDGTVTGALDTTKI